MNALKQNRKKPDRNLICFLIAIGVILVSLYYIMPWNERIGTLTAMAGALLAGIFYTRFTKNRNNQK